MRNCTEVYKELKSHGHKFDVIYDIGANVGDWTRKWKLNEPNSTFVMFEANKDINPKVSPNDIYLHEILSGNLLPARVIVVQQAVDLFDQIRHALGATDLGVEQHMAL